MLWSTHPVASTELAMAHPALVFHAHYSSGRGPSERSSYSRPSLEVQLATPIELTRDHASHSEHSLMNI
jgi:hypothetical protein